MSRQSFLRVHHKRVDGVTRQLNRAYSELTDLLIEVAKSAQISGLLNPDIRFQFEKYSFLNERVEQITRTTANYLLTLINQGTADEWEASNQCSDELVDEVFKTLNVPREQIAQYYNRNLNALLTFQQRKISGMKLSDRVWSLTQLHKSELEMAIDLAIGDGISASTLATETKRYLKEPDKLFRRVRDKHGKLQLSKPAREYNPGPGVYRSSYKNAKRMTRTELNMSFREADFERWQQLDFVSGYEIKRSNRITECDVCEPLKGIYPKTFKWRGWHPQCLCHMVSVLIPKDDLNRLEGLLLEGKSTNGFKGSNHVDKVPEAFDEFIEKNKERIMKSKNQPYWVRDNFKRGHVTGGLKIDLTPGN